DRVPLPAKPASLESAQPSTRQPTIPPVFTRCISVRVYGPQRGSVTTKEAGVPRSKTLKLATFNVNGIGTRLPHLLAWLEKEQPDIVALQELKTVDAAFPVAELEAAGYGAIWHGQKSWNGVALLARGAVPVESRRGLPGDSKDEQSRYIEAAIHGIVVAGLYLPNGNPRPGPKFDYKLAWMERLIRHARTLVD